MVTRTRTGELLREIAEDYHLTRERVRQIVAAIDPDASEIGGGIRHEQQLRAAHAAKQMAATQRRQRLAALPPCVVCWGPPQRPSHGPRNTRYHTCSPDCAQLWLLVRFHLDQQYHERHDLLMARRSLSKGISGEIVHAVNRLTGTAQRHPNRHHPYASHIRELLAEVERLRQGRTPPADALMIPKFQASVAHGTTTGYSQGCREECCRAAKRAYAADRRRAARANPNPEPAERAS